MLHEEEGDDEAEAKKEFEPEPSLDVILDEEAPHLKILDVCASLGATVDVENQHVNRTAMCPRIHEFYEQFLELDKTIERLKNGGVDFELKGIPKTPIKDLGLAFG